MKPWAEVVETAEMAGADEGADVAIDRLVASDKGHTKMAVVAALWLERQAYHTQRSRAQSLALGFFYFTSSFSLI